MRQIGFKNFRRFENFPALDLAPITIFVGENNAGKSTVVKGILALSDFLNSWSDDFNLLIERHDETKNVKKSIVEKLKNQKFYFNTSYLSHIGTFKRALYNKADGNTISFNTKLGFKELTIDVFGNKDDEESVSGVIDKISLNYNTFGINLEYDLQNNLATIKFIPTKLSEDQLEIFLPKKRENVKSFLESIPHEYVLTYKISDYYRRFAPDLIFMLMASSEIAISATMEYEKNKKYIGPEMAVDLKPISNVDEDTVSFLKKYTKNICDNPRGEKWIFRLPENKFIRNFSSIEYIYAHAVTQTVIYSAKDTNDYLSKTIHEFASMPKTDDDYRKEFIKYWMKEFNIGVDYEITSVGGEAHIVKIINDDGERVNLADKGMGSIQLMVLLFRLAIRLPRQQSSKQDANGREFLMPRMFRTIIIEEPEQNLHPMLQSKLADLFYKLNEDYGYCFIIETHSEYLIRKTQVIVKNNFNDIDHPLKENPFKVYYFNSSSTEKPYYEIEYQKDGNFFNDFGRGFFDEASNLAFEIL